MCVLLWGQAKMSAEEQAAALACMSPGDRAVALVSSVVGVLGAGTM